MKKVIFVIVLIFIAGLPFTSQAIRPVTDNNVVMVKAKKPSKERKLAFFNES